MRHVSACTMHGRRGGALVRLASQRTAALGGGHALWAASARQHFRADFPPDSAAGAGQLHLRSAQRAAILTSGAGRSGPSRLCAPYGWLAEADIKLDLIACVGGVIGMHNGEGLRASSGGERGCSAPFGSTLGVLLRVAPNAVVVQPVYVSRLSSPWLAIG
jgi:hypothetical protein